MTTTYRACYADYPGATGVVLTSPEHAHWTEADLIEEAVCEAYRAGLIGPDADARQESESALRARLVIGDWRE